MPREIIQAKNLSFKNHEPLLLGDDNKLYPKLKTAARMVSDGWVALHDWFPKGSMVHMYPDRRIDGSSDILASVVSPEEPRSLTSVGDPLDYTERMTRRVKAYKFPGERVIEVDFACQLKGIDRDQSISVFYSFTAPITESTMDIQPTQRIVVMLQPFAGDSSHITLDYNFVAQVGLGSVSRVRPGEAPVSSNIFSFTGGEYRIINTPPEFLSMKDIKLLSSFRKETAVHIVNNIILPEGRLRQAYTSDTFRDTVLGLFG